VEPPLIHPEHQLAMNERARTTQIDRIRRSGDRATLIRAELIHAEHHGAAGPTADRRTPTRDPQGDHLKNKRA
jgi:hypothetical protein